MSTLKIWMNGSLVPEPEAKLPVNSAAVFYATNVFEGIRAYWSSADEELYCFRLAEHFARIRESMKMMRFTVPYTDDDLHEAVRELLSGNDFREDIHMHLVAYVAGVGLDATEPTGLYINPRRRARVKDDAGLRCCISSWVRTSDNAIPIRLKSGSNYQNGRLATLQAKADGYDGPIFLNGQGHVAEGSGATFFMVRKGQVSTPPLTADILESITRSHAHRGPGAAGARPARGGARDRPDRGLRGRGGLLLRQRLRDHADRLDRPVPARRRQVRPADPAPVRGLSGPGARHRQEPRRSGAPPSIRAGA